MCVRERVCVCVRQRERERARERARARARERERERERVRERERERERESKRERARVGLSRFESFITPLKVLHVSVIKRGICSACARVVRVCSGLENDPDFAHDPDFACAKSRVV